VEDTGPGIAPDELDSIFEAFVQTKTGQETQEGTGLGLSISKKFVQLMGGNLTVSSQLGQGTIFKFNIQVGTAGPTANQQLTLSEVEGSKIYNRVIALEPGQPRYRILITDNYRDNRQLLVQLLKPLGFEVREASNGQEAMEIWDNWQPHLIWMNMRMSVMDGYETTRQIKSKIAKRESKIETAIIALTGSTLDEERELALSAGCDDFMRKPFKEADIFEMMHKHIGVRYVYDEGSKVAESQVSKEKSKTRAERSRSIQNLKSKIAALPSDLLTNLEQAAIRLDTNMVDSLINETRSHNAAVADMLATLAGDFRYDEIAALLQKAKENKNE
jgi:CheY-like chemotaxis protein